MNRFKTIFPVSLLALGLMGVLPLLSRADMMENKGMMKDSAMMMNNMKTETAIDGFCPVCLVHGMKMKGSDDYVTTYNGTKYMFSALEMQKEFVENPEEYSKDLDMKYQQMMKK